MSDRCTPEARLCAVPNGLMCVKAIRGEFLDYVCTRREGHDGPCVACGHDDHNLAVGPEGDSNE